MILNTEALTAKPDKLGRYAPALFLLAALLPEYVAPVFTAAVFFIVLRRRIAERKKPSFGAIGMAILIYMAWMVVCSVYSSSFISSFASVGLWCLMFTGYYTFTETVKTQEQIERIFLCGGLSAGAAGAIGVAQMVVYHLCLRTGSNIHKLFNPFWRFLDLAVEKLVVFLPDFISSNMASKTFHTFSTRACSTFSNPLFFATFCVSMLPFAAYVFLCSKSVKRQIIGFGCCLAAIGGVALSYSRGPYLFAVIVFALLFLYGGKKCLKLIALGGVGFCAIVIFADGIFKRVLTLISGRDLSVNTRKSVWDAAFKMLHERPIFGYGTGFDNVRQTMHNVYNVKQPHAHNIFLEAWLENGVLGALLLAAIFIVFFINAFRLYRRKERTRDYAVTLFASVTGFLLCGMTDCVFYGLKPLQYMMMIFGLSQAVFSLYLSKSEAENEHTVNK